MRTEDQIRRKLNEFVMQRKSLQSRLQAAADDAKPALQSELNHLEDQIMLLEWVLNKPVGSYHM
ncbi:MULTISPECIES: hypothetical protein [Paenibacillus]|uniref:Uncharacterized protein n=1 Tax=Paenibacillus naphthalenovorans TaxID=162209 RepID=A0A0U2MW45_9BACL|nr:MULTISPECIES: hypothetical protein [Paenibacillus]ALS22015.1 hypothetical protein IJ22_16410 [Paenibacillus naphthalenovorans]NTZ16745.1 hypothetical protein [Paenibacillus sp. JMULE4]GCL74234.1 hypothetical protein PN4B1_41800 [Paenibacillus naphthalenovorans]SDJ24441.1 hypothetical protein SAMN05421868_12149 [Paenibacillus naphthalenovorans]